MLRRSTVLFLTAVLFSTNAVAQESPEQAVANASARFDAAFEAGDVAVIDSLLSDDTVMISAARSWHGREAIVRFNRGIRMRRPGITLVTEPDSIEIGPSGWGVASERGTWTERWKEDGEEVVLRGNYQAMWRLHDGRWLRTALLLVPIQCLGPYCNQ